MRLYFTVDEEVCMIDLPLDVSERTFGDWCDFRTAESKYHKSNAEEPPESEIPIIRFIDCLRTLVPGEIDKIPLTVNADDDDFDELRETGYLIGLDEEISLTRIYAHLLNLVKQYVPATIPDAVFTLTWPKLAADKYMIKSSKAARILRNRSLTTGEAIEILDYRRRADVSIAAVPDEIGNTEFTLGLSELAILLRRPFEKLPSGRRDLDRFINERRRLFRDIPLNYILDIRFFLIAALLKFDPTKDSGSFGTDLRVSKSAKKARLRKRGRRRKRRLGR